LSAGTYLNSYYIAALIPPVAALCGVGVAALATAAPRVRAAVVTATAAACVGYGLYLLHGAAVVPPWLWVAAIGMLVLAVYIALFTRTVLAAVAALLILPAAASVTVVVRGLGPFDTPFESRQVSDVTLANPAARAATSNLMQRIARLQPYHRYPLAVDTSLAAAEYIAFSGDEVLPIGGFYGGVPVPTLATLRSDIRSGYVALFRLPLLPPSPDPRVQWVQQHCTLTGNSAEQGGVQFAQYFCTPADAG
jgi:hypothetical protein